MPRQKRGRSAPEEDDDPIEREIASDDVDDEALMDDDEEAGTELQTTRRSRSSKSVAHLTLRTPFYVQNHDARSASTVVIAAHHGRVTTVDALRAWEHWSTGVVLFRSRAAEIAVRPP